MIIFEGNPIGVGMLLAYSGVIAFFPVLRYVIGLKHWKDFSVVALGLSLYMWVSPFNVAWKIGLITWFFGFLIVMLASTWGRKFLIKRNLHFFAKLAISAQLGLGFSILYIVFLEKLLNLHLSQWILISISVILLVMSAETLTYLQIKKGLIEALRRTIVTFISSLFVGVIFRWRTLLIFLYNHQEFFLIFMGITILVSTWRYINISDYVRFVGILNKKD